MPDMVMVPHGNCPEDAAYVAELVRKKMGVTNVMMNNLGPVIGGSYRRRNDRHCMHGRPQIDT